MPKKDCNCKECIYLIGEDDEHHAYCKKHKEPVFSLTEGECLGFTPFDSEIGKEQLFSWEAERIEQMSW